MIVAKENKAVKQIEIDLSGPQGNAFMLIGMAGRLAKQLGMDEEEVQTEMMSGDYDHLLSVIEKYFGEYIIMYY
tara:strand:+ start:3726 stop:3947 length:222 start_codon:yes stop_codon:yes gene_type:complete